MEIIKDIKKIMIREKIKIRGYYRGIKLLTCSWDSNLRKYFYKDN